jgi:hypothetical protein
MFEIVSAERHNCNVIPFLNVNRGKKMRVKKGIKKSVREGKV